MPDDPVGTILGELPHRSSAGYDGLLGLELLELSDTLVRGRLEVRAEHLQPAGLVHGGVYCSLAESLASLGTYRVVMADGNVAVGLSNQTSFVRPITGGEIEAIATRRHAGRTTWIWDVECRDHEGRVAALTRMTIAVRPRPA